MVAPSRKRRVFSPGLSALFKTIFKAGTENNCGVVFFWAAVCAVLANGSLFAQLAHVAAPNKPVPPKLLTARVVRRDKPAWSSE
jgi:hypothetical protein